MQTLLHPNIRRYAWGGGWGNGKSRTQCLQFCVCVRVLASVQLDAHSIAHLPIWLKSGSHLLHGNPFIGVHAGQVN